MIRDDDGVAAGPTGQARREELARARAFHTDRPDDAPVIAVEPDLARARVYDQLSVVQPNGAVDLEQRFVVGFAASHEKRLGRNGPFGSRRRSIRPGIRRAAPDQQQRGDDRSPVHGEFLFV
jgi:hypothetical protein